MAAVMAGVLDRLKSCFAGAGPGQETILPDWPGLFRGQEPQWQEALAAAKGGPKVLLATGIGAQHPMPTLDSLLAVALTLRGADVRVLLCDACFPACELLTIYRVGDDMEDFVKNGVDRKWCGQCYAPAAAMFESLGIKVLGYNELISDEERAWASDLVEGLPADQIAGYQLDGLKVGEHALAGALRFFARGDLDQDPMSEPVLRHYFHSSLLTTLACRRLFRQEKYVCANFHHGIYVPQGLVGETARSQGVRVANYVVAYRSKTFIFSHGDTYHHTLMHEPVDAWENMPWTAAMEKTIDEYLASRIHGTKDWIYYHESPQEDAEAVIKELGVDPYLPCIGLLTNVMWDAQLHYPANAFPGMKEWVLDSVAYFAKRPELQLIIRVHPAEIRGGIPSRQFICDEIGKAFPSLPPNVFLVGPNSNASTYALMQCCDSVIIYGTKTGVELTSMGIPVIVAGEAWIRGKGMTMDASSTDRYHALLDGLPLGQRLGSDQMRRAKRYAFHFFFRRMIPLNCVEPVEGKARFRVAFESLRELAKGGDEGLDVICRGIMHDEPFIYPAESHLAG